MERSDTTVLGILGTLGIFLYPTLKIPGGIFSTIQIQGSGFVRGWSQQHLLHVST
jgi:hypothetical protein